MNRALACLLASSYCGTIVVPQTKETLVTVDPAAVAFRRPRRILDVHVSVADPNQVFAWPQRKVGSPFASDAVKNLDLGRGLASGAPLIWNRYLNVRTDAAAGLPTIEMSLVDVAGANTYDLSGAATYESKLQLTLLCRVLDSSGRELSRFSSTQRFEHKTADMALQDPSYTADAGLMMARAFDEILPKFFADAKMLAALPAADEAPAATAHGILAVLDLQDKLKGPKREQIDAGYLTDEIRAAALDAAPGLRIMTRENVLVMLKAQGKDLADCEGECEVDTGRRLGADYVVSGEVLQFGSSLKVNLKLHGTAEGRLLSVGQASGETVDDLDKQMAVAIHKLLKPLAHEL